MRPVLPSLHDDDADPDLSPGEKLGPHRRSRAPAAAPLIASLTARPLGELFRVSLLDQGGPLTRPARAPAPRGWSPAPAARPRPRPVDLIAQLFGVNGTTITRAVHHIQPLLADHGYTVRPSTARFRTPADVTAFLTNSNPTEIKSALAL